MSILNHYIEAENGFTKPVCMGADALALLQSKVPDVSTVRVISEAADAVLLVSYFERDFDYVDFHSKVGGEFVELRLQLDQRGRTPLFRIELPDQQYDDDLRAVHYG